jgi:hypothetical protein
MFTRGRSVHIFASMVIAASLLAASLATTFGAVAAVGIGGGTNTALFNATGVTGATPTAVSPGKVAGFYLFAKNNDSANLSSFFLKASTSADMKPTGALWSHSLSGPWTQCPITGGLNCSFGAFNSGDTIYVVAAYTLPSSPSTSKTNCFTDPDRAVQPPNSYGVNPTGATWECVHFEFSADSGYVTGKNKSRGDAYHWFDAVNTDTGPDQQAQFPFCDFSSDAACNPSLLTISDDQSLGKTNPQWTKVQVPNDRLVFNTAQNVADGTKVSQTCPTGFPTECSTAFLGQWSQVDVNAGQDFLDGTPWVVIDIGVYGVSANKISKVFHFYKDSAGVLQVEVIDTPCAESSGPTDSSGDPSLLNADQCFWVSSTLKGSSSQITIWTHHNGKFGIG